MPTARQRRQEQALERFDQFIVFDTSCFVNEDGPHNDQSNSLLSINLYDGQGIFHAVHFNRACQIHTVQDLGDVESNHRFRQTFGDTLDARDIVEKAVAAQNIEVNAFKSWGHQTYTMKVCYSVNDTRWPRTSCL